MPFSIDKSYLEVDVIISGNNKKIVKKYNYSTTKNEVSGYYRKSSWPLGLDRYKRILEKLETDINKDYAFINSELEKQ